MSSRSQLAPPDAGGAIQGVSTMSPNEREWGSFTSEVKEIDHKVRNQRMMISNLVVEIDDLSKEVIRLRAQIKTSIVAISVGTTGVIWLIEMVIR